MYSDVHLFPIYVSAADQSVVSIAAFVARKIVALKKSHATSNDADERNEIVATLMFHQSALLLLTLSCLTEETELTDLAKEIFRN